MTAPLAMPALAALAGVRHGFFGASLNCAVARNDSGEVACRSRARAARAVGAAPESLALARQVHGAAAVTAPFPDGDVPEADAIITRAPGVALGILTADCAPVLLADARAGVIGAAHAGWRGALGGVVEAAVDRMASLGAAAEHIVAAVGPCIGVASYQVGADFPAPFLRRDAAAARFFTPPDADGRPRFDLGGYVAMRLARRGVGTVEAARRDTFADPAFFSHRRGDVGRQISVIALD